MTQQDKDFIHQASLQSHTSSLATDVNNITGSRLNAAFTSSGFIYLGGQNSVASVDNLVVHLWNIVYGVNHYLKVYLTILLEFQKLTMVIFILHHMTNYY